MTETTQTTLPLAGLQAGVDANDPQAIHDLGVCYLNGKGVEYDLRKAESLFRRAAALNHPPSLYVLAVGVREKARLAEDKTEAYRLFMEAATLLTRAIDLGHVDSMYELAMMCAGGEGVERSHKKMSILISTAAEAGHDKSLFFLGYRDESQEKFEEAAEWYRRSRSAGYHDATCRLAYLLQDGHVEPLEDPQEDADALFEEAAEGGCADAMLACGWKLAEQSTETDEEGSEESKALMQAAMAWFRRAAKAGNVEAQYVVGMKVYSEPHLALYEGEAIEYLELAAAANYTNSAEMLAEAKRKEAAGQ